jgi:hypothetical protein
MIGRLVYKTREIKHEVARELFCLNRFRRIAAMWGSPAPYVYDWSSWSGTLIRNIVPRAKRIAASFEESPQELAARLPSGALTMLVHLDISDNGPFITDATEFLRILAQRNVTVLNGQVRDIRKSTVQSACTSFGLPSVKPAPIGDPDELLIVKTDLNSAGARELRLTAEQRARYNLPATTHQLKNRDGYFVSRRAELTADIWNDPNLAVERFMQNPHGRFFRVYVLVNAVVISVGHVGSQIKRIGSADRRENYWLWRQGENIQMCSGTSSDIPSGLLRTMGVFIDRFHLDFGAMDVVESEAGDFYIIDVNKTPFWDDEHQPGLLKHLRLGLQTSAQPLLA